MTTVDNVTTNDEIQQEESGNAVRVWVGMILFGVLFTILIFVLGPLLDRFVLGPDTGAEWYYWQLPTRNDLAMLITWSFYLSQQIIVWGLIYWGMKKYGKSTTTGLTGYNYAMIVTTIAFAFLHLFQTHVTYDGLAKDIPIWTSQGSVIVMLVLILIIENPRRGLFLGKRAGKPITAQVAGFFRRNHGYVIAWAIVYTYWFHPMAMDPQLLTGFLYMFLLFTQMSLAFTVVHTKAGWIVLLESFVAVHAFVVAVYNVALGSSDMWPMFLMGFAFLVVFTYIYVFKPRKEVRFIAALVYIAGLIWIYLPAPFGYGRDLMRILMLEFLWIPIVLYLLAYVFAGLAYLYLKVEKRE
ncbi:MAG: hypothetical protein RTU30_02150 [Candidatus Thorarchaeota archaeon]